MAWQRRPCLIRGQRKSRLEGLGAGLGRLHVAGGPCPLCRRACGPNGALSAEPGRSPSLPHSWRFCPRLGSELQQPPAPAPAYSRAPAGEEGTGRGGEAGAGAEDGGGGEGEGVHVGGAPCCQAGRSLSPWAAQTEFSFLQRRLPCPPARWARGSAETCHPAAIGIPVLSALSVGHLGGPGRGGWQGPGAFPVCLDAELWHFWNRFSYLLSLLFFLPLASFLQALD